MTDQRYMKPGIDLAVGELVEELGELQQALGKVIRFGWKNTNPGAETNEEGVLRESIDVIDAIENLLEQLAHPKAQLRIVKNHENSIP